MVTQAPSSKRGRKEMKTIPYVNPVRNIMYEMVYSRSNLEYVVSVVSRFMVDPTHTHLEALKWVYRKV